VRTRTLLLLAVACGVAILAAGVIQLLRLAGQDEPARPAAIGAPVRVGDLTVVVDGYAEDADRVDVRVELGGVDDPDAAADFRLVVPGASLSPVDADGTHGTPDGGGGAPCVGSTREPVTCTLSFTLPDDSGTTRVLLLRRGDEQVRWDLTTA
jgi:hypothetical protein